MLRFRIGGSEKRRNNKTRIREFFLIVCSGEIMKELKENSDGNLYKKKFEKKNAKRQYIDPKNYCT